jgi:hypothetical protein
MVVTFGNTIGLLLSVLSPKSVASSKQYFPNGFPVTAISWMPRRQTGRNLIGTIEFLNQPLL